MLKRESCKISNWLWFPFSILPPFLPSIFPFFCVCVCVSCSVVSDSLWTHGPSGSSVYGILQARILEKVAIPFSRESSRPRDWIWVLQCCGQILYHLSHQGSPFPSLIRYSLHIYWMSGLLGTESIEMVVFEAPQLPPQPAINCISIERSTACYSDSEEGHLIQKWMMQGMTQGGIWVMSSCRTDEE